MHNIVGSIAVLTLGYFACVAAANIHPVCALFVGGVIGFLLMPAKGE